MKKLLLASAGLLLCLVSCREDDVIFIPETVPVTDPVYSSISGFYLLNEGNMGSNKATLDYFDYSTGNYNRNIYAQVNPDVPKEMGDVGNDLQIYGTKMYAVINCSNKIEVMDAASARRIGQVDIPNVRYIRFAGAYAYATSYAGPVQIDQGYKQLGYVAKIDTATLKVVDSCTVGYQPDQLEIQDGKIYVANSGGYMVPRYEKTLSVISLDSFEVTESIPIAINLHLVKADRRGCLWITSRGDYYDTQAALYCYDTRKHRIEKKLDIPVSAMDMAGDSLYIVSAQWSYETMSNTPSYTIVNTATMEKVSDSFITDDTDKEIKIPYAVKVNPLTHEILVCDARNYVNPGYLHCYSPKGVRLWSARTGDIPAHIAFTGLTEYPAMP